MAEVLITLSIIGIVAAMTVPTLMHRYQEHILITRLLQNYSLIQNSYQKVLYEEGAPEDWNLGKYPNWNLDGSKFLAEKFTAMMKVKKLCVSTTGCWPANGYKELSGRGKSTMRTNGFVTLILENGTAMRIYLQDKDCNTTMGLSNICGGLGVDVNGFEKPNQLGVDYFHFWITKNNIVPANYEQGSEVNSCSIYLNNPYNGWGCTNWALTHRNMDYRRMRLP